MVWGSIYTLLLFLASLETAKKNLHGFVATGLIILLGFFLWTLLEYLLHRYIFHFKPKSRIGRKIMEDVHYGHHKNPTAYKHLITHLSFGTMIAFIYLGIILIITRNIHITACLGTGIALGFVMYEYVHYQIHTREIINNAYLQSCKEHHLKHHNVTGKKYFGVITKFWDRVFSTY